MDIVKSNIANALTSAAKDHVLGVANDIYDETLGKYQSEINAENKSNLDGLSGIKIFKVTDDSDNTELFNYVNENGNNSVIILYYTKTDIVKILSISQVTPNYIYTGSILNSGGNLISRYYIKPNGVEISAPKLDTDAIADSAVTLNKLDSILQHPFKVINISDSEDALDDCNDIGYYIISKRINTGVTIPFILQVIKFNDAQNRQVLYDLNNGCIRYRGKDENVYTQWKYIELDGQYIKSNSISLDKLSQEVNEAINNIPDIKVFEVNNTDNNELFDYLINNAKALNDKVTNIFLKYTQLYANEHYNRYILVPIKTFEDDTYIYSHVFIDVTSNLLSNLTVTRTSLVINSENINGEKIYNINGNNIQNNTISLDKVNTQLQSPYIIYSEDKLDELINPGTYMITPNRTGVPNIPHLMQVVNITSSIRQVLYDIENTGLFKYRIKNEDEDWTNWTYIKLDGNYIKTGSITTDKLEEDIQTRLTLVNNLRDIMQYIASGNNESLNTTFDKLKALGDNYKSIYHIAQTLKTFLESADTSDNAINRWKEIETFLAGITDTETLTGLLEELKTEINSELNVKDVDGATIVTDEKGVISVNYDSKYKGSPLYNANLDTDHSDPIRVKLFLNENNELDTIVEQRIYNGERNINKEANNVVTEKALAKHIDDINANIPTIDNDTIIKDDDGNIKCNIRRVQHGTQSTTVSTNAPVKVHTVKDDTEGYYPQITTNVYDASREINDTSCNVVQEKALVKHLNELTSEIPNLKVFYVTATSNNTELFNYCKAAADNYKNVLLNIDFDDTYHYQTPIVEFNGNNSIKTTFLRRVATQELGIFIINPTACNFGGVIYNGNNIMINSIFKDRLRSHIANIKNLAETKYNKIITSIKATIQKEHYINIRGGAYCPDINYGYSINCNIKFYCYAGKLYGHIIDGTDNLDVYFKVNDEEFVELYISNIYYFDIPSTKNTYNNYIFTYYELDSTHNNNFNCSFTSIENITEELDTTDLIKFVRRDSINDGSITTIKLADGTITNAKLADNSVNHNKIINYSILNRHLSDNAVTTSKIQDGQVTTPKLADGSITKEKLTTELYNDLKAATSLPDDWELADGSVTTAKIANNAVTKTQLSNELINQIESIPDIKIFELNSLHDTELFEYCKENGIDNVFVREVDKAYNKQYILKICDYDKVNEILYTEYYFNTIINRLYQIEIKKTGNVGMPKYINIECLENNSITKSKLNTSIFTEINNNISTEIAKIVANAPEDFDTLKEISDWISTHADDASAMNTQITDNTAAITEINTNLEGYKIKDVNPNSPLFVTDGLLNMRLYGMDTSSYVSSTTAETKSPIFTRTVLKGNSLAVDLQVSVYDGSRATNSNSLNIVLEKGLNAQITNISNQLSTIAARIDTNDIGAFYDADPNYSMLSSNGTYTATIYYQFKYSSEKKPININIPIASFRNSQGGGGLISYPDVQILSQIMFNFDSTNNYRTLYEKALPIATDAELDEILNTI